MENVRTNHRIQEEKIYYSQVTKLKPYEEYVVECLRKYPYMSNSVICLDFFRKTVKVRQYEVVDDPPMYEQAQIVLGEMIRETVTGKHKKVYCFGMVMSNSRKKFSYWLDKP